MNLQTVPQQEYKDYCHKHFPRLIKLGVTFVMTPVGMRTGVKSFLSVLTDAEKVRLEQEEFTTCEYGLLPSEVEKFIRKIRPLDPKKPSFIQQLKGGVDTKHPSLKDILFS